jgi:hypothetical protein
MTAYRNQHGVLLPAISSSVLKIADAIKSGIAYRCSYSDRVIIGDRTMFRYDLFFLSFNFHH